MNTKYICIEGNLGAGKTTLAKKIADTLEVKLVLETFMNNPFLKGLYEDKEESKFPAETFFLMERMEQLSPELFSNNELIVSDYLIDKTSLFAKTNLKGKELALFQRVFETVKTQIPEPNALIYIDQTPEQALQHVIGRGRKLEAHVTLKYLAHLDDEYQKMLNTNNFSFPVYRIEATRLRTHFNDTLSEIIDFLVKERLLLAKDQVKLSL
ncbi:MAG: deoxyguanosine kinase [Salibacteraceae bacterium]|jgi:deoxyadenosine/deoxycytidine kinase